MSMKRQLNQRCRPANSHQRSLMRVSGVAVTLGLGLILSGCGRSVPTAAPTKSHQATKPYRQPGTGTFVEGATPYAGQKNLAHYLALAKSHPTSVNALFHVAVAEFVNGHFSQAVADYKEALRLDPKNPTLWNNLGNIYNYTLKKPQTALPDYQRAVTLPSSNAVDWFNLVNCEVNLKNPKQAQADAVKALSVLPKSSGNAYYQDLVKVAHPSHSTASN